VLFWWPSKLLISLYLVAAAQLDAQRLLRRLWWLDRRAYGPSPGLAGWGATGAQGPAARG